MLESLLHDNSEGPTPSLGQLPIATLGLLHIAFARPYTLRGMHNLLHVALRPQYGIVRYARLHTRQTRLALRRQYPRASC